MMCGLRRQRAIARATLCFAAALFFGLGASATVSAAAPQRAKIAWASSLDAAIAAAGQRKAPIVVAIHCELERASHRFLSEHYKDAQLAKLAAKTVNVFCSRDEKALMPGVTAAVQQACYQELRAKAFGEGEDRWIQTQHLFLSPEGTVLGSVNGALTKGELEWALAWVLRKVDPNFQHELSDAARAPTEFRFGSSPYPGSRIDEPPTKGELDAAVAELAKGGMAVWGNARELIPKLVFSDEPKVLEFGVLALTFGRGRRGGGQGGQGGGSERRVSMLDLIAKHSPADWARVVVKTIGDSEEDVRKAAALALAALQDSAFIPDLTKRYQDKDETAAVRAVLLRALVELEPKSSKHVRAIEKLVASSKDEALRVQAIVAAAKLENRKAVTAILGRGLADASALVRQTTAYVIASRRDEALLSNLRFVAENEADAPTKALLEAAIAAVDDGPLTAFTDLLESIGLKR